MNELIWLAVVLSAALYAVAAIFYFGIIKNFSNKGKIAISAGLICNIAAICLRGILIGRAPVANGPDFLLVFTALTALLYVVFAHKSGTNSAGVPVSLMCAAICAIVLVYMGDQLTEAQPLPPVLNSPLLQIHVITAAAAYAGFAVSAGLAAVRLIKGSADDGEKWIYYIISGSFALLTFTIVIGAVWAEQSWGRYWGWDPKETWALITWLIYAIYLHLHRIGKWKGKSANIIVIVGFFIVLFTFFGVNYILSGLHSYGL